jgi:hypothetical protein
VGAAFDAAVLGDGDRPDKSFPHMGNLRRFGSLRDENHGKETCHLTMLSSIHNKDS